ncbi:hypothetical protein H5410_059998, partial [Solanum commersonii]
VARVIGLQMGDVRVSSQRRRGVRFWVSFFDFFAKKMHVLICFARKKKGAWIASHTTDGVRSVFSAAIVSIWELLMNVMWVADLNGSWTENWPNFGLKLSQ